MQKKFEYFQLYRDIDSPNYLNEATAHKQILNDMGADGWELVSIIENKLINKPAFVFYFKREIE